MIRRDSRDIGTIERYGEMRGWGTPFRFLSRIQRLLVRILRVTIVDYLADRLDLIIEIELRISNLSPWNATV